MTAFGYERLLLTPTLKGDTLMVEILALPTFIILTVNCVIGLVRLVVELVKIY